MVFRLEQGSPAQGFGQRIMDDHGVIALVKARGKAVNAGQMLAAAPQMLAALNVVRMSNGWRYLAPETHRLIDSAIAAAEGR